MKRLSLAGFLVIASALAGCTGGAAGDPSDDVGDIFVLSHSPGNGAQLDLEDSADGFNALNSPTLQNPGAVTLVFTNSLMASSVLNPDPSDPQGTRNVRLFFFDTEQGPFDPEQPRVPGVNPPGANVLISAQTVLTSTNQPNDTLVIRPTGISSTSPMREGQYSVVVEAGVQGADGDGMKGQEYFFFFRVGEDGLGPVVVSADPAPGETGIDPTSEIRVTFSETIAAGSINNQNITVTYQPAGAANPTPVPGTWFVDGGNGPGNNFPAVQLDHNGNAGFSGTSPRNGVDLVFRPSLTAFPTNMTAQDPNDPFCTLISDPPRKGNHGMPLGQAITVTFVNQGVGVTDTAGNGIPTGSPNASFTFQTTPRPLPVFAPNATGGIYYGDTIGVGVIDVNPARTPYTVGPNPARSPNSVVTVGGGSTVRVPISDLVDMQTDSRPWTSFYAFPCSRPLPSIFQGNVYALSRSQRGGEITVIDTFLMKPLGRFGTPSPGGIAMTAVNTTVGRAAVSNFSANTVTVFDISQVNWFTGPTVARQFQLVNQVANGTSQLLLSESDFTRAFPAQRSGGISPPGPPIIGTLNVGVSPGPMAITGLPGSLGNPGFPCFSPILANNTIIATLNTGESTVDFSEVTNLQQSQAIQPSLDGVNVSSPPLAVTWSPPSNGTGSNYFFITSVGGTVELFATGFISNQPSVRPESSNNLAPNKIINSIGGFVQPAAVQWITNGNAVSNNNGYSFAVLVAETGENRLQQVAVTSEFPSNLFDTINTNLSAGLGPIAIAGDPAGANSFNICGPRFTNYYVANAGEGTVRLASYLGGVIGTEIPVPGVLRVSSWWNR